jgi:hypothetical protein
MTSHVDRECIRKKVVERLAFFDRAKDIHTKMNSTPDPASFARRVVRSAGSLIARSPERRKAGTELEYRPDHAIVLLKPFKDRHRQRGVEQRLVDLGRAIWGRDTRRVRGV